MTGLGLLREPLLFLIWNAWAEPSEFLRVRSSDGRDQFSITLLGRLEFKARISRRSMPWPLIEANPFSTLICGL
jgi:hypothetical protein